ncbi:YqcI/YcgG family protein [Bradyrhizobium manausense]|uniref:YqcI/YcgG family protein n=1 Tax=Bradyrhizobium manausense TaxID=989370 RepID=UPI00138ED1BA|nr:YqcI/YcgG family protein [Bradyrhizobium manausense]
MLKGQTLCPFAQSASIEYGPPWSDTQDFRENVSRIAKALRAHLIDARKSKLQGFVIGIRGDGFDDFSRVVSTFRDFVFELGRHDSSCRASLKEDISAPEWNLIFADEPIFLNLFAGCYPAPHSKRINDTQNIYVFFQPEFTFDFCNVNRKRAALKSSIRNSFAEAGMPYDGSTIDTRRKALSYVFPLRSGDPPIDWWSTPSTCAVE